MFTKKQLLYIWTGLFVLHINGASITPALMNQVAGYAEQFDGNLQEALIYAVRTDDGNMVAALLAVGADPNYIDQSGYTALTLAKTNANSKITKLLITAGANLHIDEASITPALMDQIANYAEQFDGNLQEALIYAVRTDDANMVADLLAVGVDPNYIDQSGYTALTLAKTHANSKITELLIAAGANLHINEASITPALMIQVANYAKKFNGNFKEALRQAVKKGDTDIVEGLLAAGANFKHAGGIKYPLLIKAVDDKRADIVQLLLEAGANVNDADRIGNTALIHATLNNDTDIVQLLLKAGADVNQVDIDGNTPLRLATTNLSWDNIDITKILLDAGANVNHADKHGNTPLIYAILAGHTDIVQLLLEAGANIHHANDNGYTPFTAASTIANKKKRGDIIQLLLEYAQR